MPRRRLRRLLSGFATVGSVLLGSLSAFSPGAAAAPANGPLSPAVAVGDGAPALPTGLDADSWLVVDLTSGNVLAARAGSAERAPASTLKILTALTFAPGAPPEIEATPQDTAVSGRTVGLRPGVRYKTSDLLDALFVAGGNDDRKQIEAHQSGAESSSQPGCVPAWAAISSRIARTGVFGFHPQTRSAFEASRTTYF